MAAEKRIPEELRRRLSDALQRSVPEALSPTQLSALINELAERGYKDLQRELYAVVVGAVPSEEFAKQAEVTEKVNQIKGGLTSERDERGRRHPSRAKHFMLISAGTVLLIGFLIWNSFRPLARPPRPAPTQVEAQAPSPENNIEPEVNLGEVAEPLDKPEPQSPIQEEPLEPTVPAPSFGTKGGFEEPANDFYAYGLDGVNGVEAQGPGMAANVSPLTGGGGTRLALTGGGSGTPNTLSGGVAVSARLATGSAGKARALAGGKSGSGLALGGYGMAGQTKLRGGMAMEQTPERSTSRTVLASTSSPAREVPAARTLEPAANRRLSVPAAPSSPVPSRDLARAANSLAPGTLLEGQIEAAPVLATGLPEAPVSVRDKDGRVWLGVAKLAGASGRAMIVLDEVVMHGRLYRTKASVLSTDRVYGVKVEVKEVSPALASSTLRAALGGVAEYVKGVQNATKVYVDPQGNRVEETQPARIEWVVAKRLAKVFDLPIEEKAVSRIFVIKSGEPVRILIRQEPQPSDGAR